MRMRIPLSQTEVPAVKAAFGFEGATEGRDYRGVPVFAAIRKVPETEWYLIAKLDSGEVRAELRWRSALLGTVAVSLILTAGAIVLVLWRRQQVQSESLVSEHFRTGGGRNGPRFVRRLVCPGQSTVLRNHGVLQRGTAALASRGYHAPGRPGSPTGKGSVRLLAGRLVTFSRNKRYIHKNGSIICARLTVSILRTPAGRPVHLSAWWRMSPSRSGPRRRCGGARSASGMVVEHAPDGILVDTGLTFRYANAEAMRMFGASDPAELIGCEVLERIHPGDRAAV